MKMTLTLTKDSREDLEELYRRMCVNVYAHNCNDHLEKFSFLYNEEEKRWRLAPAYGLRFTTPAVGTRMLSVGGNKMVPSAEELAAAGVRVGFPKEKCLKIAEEVETIVKENIKLNV
jgi:serine/threonine-protein kinase HipA